MAITAIVLGAAVPSYQDFLTRRRIEGRAHELAADLQFVRIEAIARNAALRVSVQRYAAGSCYVIHTGSANDCICDGSGPARCERSAIAIKTVSLPTTEGIDLQSSAPSMLFHPARGTTTPTATLKIVGPRGRAIHHVVNVMGRIRSCSPLGDMPGYKPC